MLIKTLHVYLFLCFLMLPRLCSANTIHLKNGVVVEGEIAELTDSYVIINKPNGKSFKLAFNQIGEDSLTYLKSLPQKKRLVAELAKAGAKEMPVTQEADPQVHVWNSVVPNAAEAQQLFSEAMQTVVSQPEQAVQKLQKVLLYDQNNGQVHYYLAMAYVGTGEIASALEEHDKAITLGFNDFPTGQDMVGQELKQYALTTKDVTYKSLDGGAKTIHMEGNAGSDHEFLADVLLGVEKARLLRGETDSITSVRAQFTRWISEYAFVQKWEINRKTALWVVVNTRPPEGFPMKLQIKIAENESDATLESLEQFDPAHDSVERVGMRTTHVDDFKRGEELFNAKRLEESIPYFDKAIQEDPKNEKALFFKGNAYYYLGRFEEAIAQFSIMVKLNPNGGMAYGNRGHAYMNIGRMSEALADFNQALEINPNDVMALGNRANLYVMLKEYKKAVEDYSKEIEANPSPQQSKSYGSRAAAYFYLGEYEKSLSDARKAQELGLPVDPNLVPLLEEKLGGHKH